MKDSINHSGYIKTYCESGRLMLTDNNDKYDDDINSTSVRFTSHYAYDFNNGELVIHAFERIPEIDGSRYVLGHDFESHSYLFHTELPIDMQEYGIYPKNSHYRVDYVIKDYEMGSKCTTAVFEFDELQYFCPSTSVVTVDKDRYVTFAGKDIELKEFEITVNSILCDVRFIVGSKGKQDIAHANMESFTQIRITFPETDDFEFLRYLYLIVDGVFAFICNRRNTTCLSMRLIGSYPSKTIKDKEIIDFIKRYNSEAIYYDKYREAPENNRVIANMWKAKDFLLHIDKLFQIVADDLSGDSGGTISIESIHPSLNRRNLIDLQQSIQIIGAFEFYVRKYLPSMVHEESYHTEIREVLEDLAKKSTGHKRKLAKELSNNVVREPALEDKICKVYGGYEGWQALAPCLSDEWFKKNEIRFLAHEANQWRNDLAHSKRLYETKEDTIRAVWLIEHLNYAIVGRQLGYNDEEIKDLLENVLTRLF